MFRTLSKVALVAVLALGSLAVVTAEEPKETGDKTKSPQKEPTVDLDKGGGQAMLKPNAVAEHPSAGVPVGIKKKEGPSRTDGTKATVAKLNELVMRRYWSYATRRVPLNLSGMTPGESTEIHLYAIRDLMRMEMPERWSDVSCGPMTLKSSDGKVSTSIPQPALHRIYQDKYSNPTKYGMQQPGRDHAQAKCLYLWVMLTIPEAKTMFTGPEIADVDGDGWKSFVDVGGRPIGYLRWAPGFSPNSDIQIADPAAHHDPFDFRKVDPAGYQLFPLIYAGVIRKDRNGNDDYGISLGENIQPTILPCTANASVGVVTSGGPPLVTNHKVQQPKDQPIPSQTVEVGKTLHVEAKVTDTTKQITNSIGMKLTLIPAGEFKMGSGESAEATAAFFNKTFGASILKADTFAAEHPPHRVRITKPFYLCMYHVTRGQFREFFTETGYKTDGEKEEGGGQGWNLDKKWVGWDKKYSWRDAGFEQTDEHPVVNVSWNDAMAFCNWLSKKEGKTYRLPTEAEWEYACRAGTTTRYYSGDDPETLVKVGNVADATLNAKVNYKQTIQASDGYVFTAPVGKFQSNAFGLYDMHGNAWQWCADWYGEKYYAASPAEDPAGPDSGNARVLRGGSWITRSFSTRSATRIQYAPQYRTFDIGFRVARTQ